LKMLTRWEACDVHPDLGTASFDGLEILTDRMTDPRWDRVLPIFEDEQVLFTRLMEDRLVSNSLLLDVGTGSGVLAIWAAKKGCRVIAIDVSERAIEFGQENARRNDVAIARDFARVRKGEILFVRQAVEDFARVATNAAVFDFVVLNPPYNPTCEVVKPALHANAGPDAQGPFEKQIGLVPQLLKIGGYCLGVQMSYDTDEAHVQAVELIRKAFDERASIKYAHAHSDPVTVGVDALVRYEYEPWLAGKKGSKSDQAKVASYVKQIAANGQRFSLIHYEVQKKSAKVVDSPCQESLPVAKRMSWNPRLWCHRCIAEFASPWPESPQQPAQRPGDH